MRGIKYAAAALLMLFTGFCLCVADSITWKPPRYYGFSVSFRHGRYGGYDEEILEERLGEPLEDALDYMSARYRNNYCDCMDITMMDFAKVYRDIECGDYSSIIVLTDTGTYIRARFGNMLEYGEDQDTDFKALRDIFLLDDKELEKVKVHDIYDGDWRMYDSFILENERAKRFDELLRIKYPRVKGPAHEGFSSDFMFKITLFYSSGERHIIGIDRSERCLYAYDAWSGLTEAQYYDLIDALGLDKRWF